MTERRQRLAVMICKGEDEQGIRDHRNGFKTVCTSEVLADLGINENEYRFSQTVGDVKRISRRHGYTFKNENVNQFSELAKLPRGIYLVYVEGHVALYHIGSKGGLLPYSDTDPESTETKKLLAVYKVGRKK